MSTPTQVAADFGDWNRSVVQRIVRAVALQGALLQADVKRNANTPRTAPRPGSGGPRLLTGHYNRSIGRRTTRTSTGATATVGTNAPQGHRLEVGFHGEDALGRRVQQRAYPHFGPALDARAAPFEKAVAEATLPPGSK